jgi:hypothetical protein
VRAALAGFRAQANDAGLQAGTFQAAGEEARSALASLVDIVVEGDKDATASRKRLRGVRRLRR